MKIKLPYSNFTFDPNKSISNSFKGIDLDIEERESTDINSDKFVSFIKKIKFKYLIYSGKAGIIVNKKLLKACHGIIHIHGGYLPEYRSTTFYYSILNEFTLGATAILLNSKIDEGDYLLRKKIKPIKKINVDYLQDPILRATVLTRTIRKIKKFGVDKILCKQKAKVGKTYQVIHLY